MTSVSDYTPGRIPLPIRVLGDVNSVVTRLARLEIVSDINREYATVMNYPTIDRFLVAILWWHLGFAGLMAFANSVLRLSESFPSPFSWRVLSTREAAIAMLVAIVAVAIPSRLRGTFRNHYAWRILVSTAFTVYSYLFVFLSGGSIEMHFHFFMVMALLAIYSDWRLGWVVLILTAVHHGILNYVAPGWVYFYGRNDLAVVAHALPVAATAIFTSLLCSNNRRSVAMLAQRIEDRKRAEQALRRSETYLAEAQRLTHTGSWAYNPATWKPTYWSDEMYRIWGFGSQPNIAPDLAARTARTHEEDRVRVRERIDKAFREGIAYEEDYRIVLPDGTVKHLHAIGHPVFDEAGEIVEYVGTTVDVTERKQAEEEREKAHRLEADLAHINRVSMMGELAASLAHELNQPIAAAVTNARTCLRWLARDQPDLEEAREAARRIVNDGTRAAEIIARIRSFYAKKRPQWEAVDINEVAGEMLVLLRNEADRHGISMRADLAVDLPTVTADRVQLQQVFMNLMLNGIEAMRDLPGELVITSARGEDGHIVVSVRDSGVGLPPEKADQIYEAFFTTKPHGTGMGLAITRSIVERHGGRLWAAANSGQGATFHFTVPVNTEAS